MSFLTMNKPFNLVSDGKTLFLIMDDLAYKVIDPFVQSVDMSISSPSIDVTTLDGFSKTIPTFQSYALDLSICSGCIEVFNNPAIEIEKELFKNVSVYQLLNIINKKLLERKT